MILAVLNQYYDRLADTPDPDTGKLIVPEFGFSNEKINYILVISKEGDIVDVVFQLEINEWNGNRELQMNVLDLKFNINK